MPKKSFENASVYRTPSLSKSQLRAVNGLLILFPGHSQTAFMVGNRVFGVASCWSVGSTWKTLKLNVPFCSQFSKTAFCCGHLERSLGKRRLVSITLCVMAVRWSPSVSTLVRLVYLGSVDLVWRQMIFFSFKSHFKDAKRIYQLLAAFEPLKLLFKVSLS